MIWNSNQFFERLLSSFSLSCARWDNFEFDLRISTEDLNVCTLTFSIFLLKTQRGLWHLYPSLSIHHSLCLDSVDIKVLDLCWKVKHSQNLVVKSNFSLLISFEYNASLQTTKTSINLVLLWYLFVVFCSPDICFSNCPSVSVSRFGQLC